MRFASVVTVASRVESFLGIAVAGLEREEREEEFSFQMVDLGESTAHFRFATKCGWFVCRLRLRRVA